MGSSSSHQTCASCSRPELYRLACLGTRDTARLVVDNLYSFPADPRLDALKRTLVILDDSWRIRSRRQTCQICEVIASALDKLAEPDSGSCFMRGRVAFGWRLRGFNEGPANITSRIQVVHIHLSAKQMRLEVSKQDIFNGMTAKFDFENLNSLVELQLAHKRVPTTRPPLNIWRVWNNSQRQPKNHAFSGRLINPSGIDFQLARRWVTRCLENHSTCHHEYRSQRNPSENFFLVDTKRLCICRAPPDAPYVALSYCWGLSTSKESLQHLEENSDFLQTQGSLASNTVPRTIQDAIVFVQKLQLQYLWVDILCIIQDNPRIKSQQIAAMDAIYNSATLTIIAASGVAADSGIPGVQAGTRPTTGQKTLRVGEITLLTVLDWSKDGDIAESPWASRAWTLQEHFLSRRKIFVTEKQIYWQCSEECWVEETVLEDIPSLGFSRHAIGPLYAFDLIRNPRFHQFAMAVSDYMLRNLTYRSDTLLAFGGVMKVLQETGARSFTKGFVWGLPVCEFNAALSWEIECSGRDSAPIMIHGEEDALD